MIKKFLFKSELAGSRKIKVVSFTEIERNQYLRLQLDCRLFNRLINKQRNKQVNKLKEKDVF